MRDGGSGTGLAARVESLLAALEKITRNSELRQKQSADLIEDLKRANEYVERYISSVISLHLFCKGP